MRLLFSFSGRIGRAQWFLGQLVGTVFYLGWILYAARNLADFEISSTGVMPEPELFNPMRSGPFLVTAALWVWIFLATTSKRFHDRGFSGLWALIGLLPMVTNIWFANTCPLCTGDEFLVTLAGAVGLINYLVGPLLLIMCGVAPGEPGPNTYGPPPGERASQDYETDGIMPPTGLAKLDDAFFERYKNSTSTRTDPVQARNPIPQSPQRPVFGKR